MRAAPDAERVTGGAEPAQPPEEPDGEDVEDADHHEIPHAQDRNSRYLGGDGLENALRDVEVRVHVLDVVGLLEPLD